VLRIKTAVQAKQAGKLGGAGPPDARHEAAQQARDAFGALGIAAQPKEVVRGAAGQVRRGVLQLDRLVPRTQHAERVNRSVPQNPGVFAAAAALHGDHRPLGAGHTHQSGDCLFAPYFRERHRRDVAKILGETICPLVSRQHLF